MASKTDIDLLVRLGVLEKLVERLMNKVDALSQPVLNQSSPDEWEINNLNGTVEPKKGPVEPDDLTNMLQS